ncbi:MAG: hypothetical protein ACYCQJ_14955 [Nitrososphaerales archaeon]
MVTVTYSCISEGGQAVFRNSKGEEILRVNQPRIISVIIDRQGNLRLKDLGIYEVNVVRFYLFNPSRYGMNVSYLDNNYEGVWPADGTFNSDCSSPFFNVPEAININYMKITINLVSEITEYTGDSIPYSLTVVKKEIIYKNPNEQRTYEYGEIAFNIDKLGNVSITSIPDYSAPHARLVGVNNPYTVKYMLYNYLTGYPYAPKEYCIAASSGTPLSGPLDFQNVLLYVFPPVIDPCEGKPCGGQCSNQTCPIGSECTFQNGYYACSKIPCTVCGGTCNVQSCPVGFECKLQPDGNYGCSAVVTPCTACGGTCNVQSCGTGFECKLQVDGNYGCSAVVNPCTACGGTCNVQSCGTGFECKLQVDGNYGCSPVVTPCTTCGGTCNVQSCPTGFECKLQADGNYGCSAVVNPCAGKPCGGNCEGPCTEGDCIKDGSGKYSCVIQTKPVYQRGWFIGLMVGIGALLIIVVLALVIWSVKKKHVEGPEEPTE